VRLKRSTDSPTGRPKSLDAVLSNSAQKRLLASPPLNSFEIAYSKVVPKLKQREPDGATYLSLYDVKK